MELTMQILAPVIVFVTKHIILLLIAWAVVILVGGALPPLPPNSGFYKTWAYTILHTASLNFRVVTQLFPGFSKTKFQNGNGSEQKKE